MKLHITLLVLFISFLSGSLWAQNATIKGLVTEDRTGEPVPFANVTLKGTDIGTTTDVHGLFIFSKLAKGKYEVLIRYVSFETESKQVEITGEEQIVQLKFTLKKSALMLKGVDVVGDKEDRLNETNTSVTKITPKQIQQIPTVGGQADIAQYMQVIPGIIFTGDQGGQLYIRGGSPIQNKVLLDGMVIYNPFHSIGLFSVFETDILKNVDVYTGGFNAEYGGRISSIMDISTRDGNKRRLSGKVGGSLFGATALLEGPLSKPKENATGNSSFILSFKDSYLQQTSPVFYKYANEDGLPFNFTDLYGKLSFNADNGSKFNVFGFNFNDKVTGYESLADYSWNNVGGGFNFVVVPSSIPMIMEGVVAYSDYNITLEDQSGLPKNSEISNTNIDLNFTYFIGKNTIKYGVDFQAMKTDIEFYNSAKKLISLPDNTSDLSLFGKFKWNINSKVILEPGIRGIYYASLGLFSPEPRLAFKYNFKPDLRFKAAAGLYSQNLVDSRSDKDIVNLFTGFISSPEPIPSTFKGATVSNNLQKAQHLIAGVEKDIFEHITLNLEAYYKNFSQLINVNRDKIYDDNAFFADKPDYLKTDFIIEKGNAYGLDFSFKYDYNRLYIWTVYSLGFVNREDEIRTYPTSFDRRHNVNILASYTFGEHFDWQVDVRWNYGSGFPFTQLQGAYEKNPFTGGITTDYLINNGNIAYIYAEINQGRLPDYHRLDVSVKKKWFFKGNTVLEAVASVTNVYNRKNIFYYDVEDAKIIYQLPIMPSLGLYLKF